jgi:hypothetical protein
MRCHCGIAALIGRLTPLGLAIALMGCQTTGPAATSNSLEMERPRTPESNAQPSKRTTQGPGSNKKHALVALKRGSAGIPRPDSGAGSRAAVIMGIGF